MSVGSPPRRPLLRRLLRSLLLVTLLVAASLVGVLTWATSGSAGRLARRLVEEHGGRLLGHDLFVRELDVVALFPPAVTLGDVTIVSRDVGREGLPLLTVQRMDLALGPGLSLRRRAVPVDVVSVLEPRVRVALEGNVLRDYAALIARLTPDPALPRRTPVSVSLRHLDVGGGAARLTVAPLGLSASIAGLFLQFDDPSPLRSDAARATRSLPAPGAFRIDDIEVMFGAIRERATLRQGTFEVDDGVLSFADYALDLRTGEVRFSGEVPLRSGPGTAGVRVEAEADLDLAALREALPTLPELSGSAVARVTARWKGRRPELAFELNTEAVEALIHGPRRDLRFVLGDASLRGYLIEDLLKITRSSLAWGGGRVGIEAAVTLSDVLPVTATLTVEEVDLAQVLESVTVPGSWVQMGITGEIAVAGALKDPLRGVWADGRATLAVSDLIVRDGAWDSPRPRTVMLHVPRARIAAGVVVDRVGVHLVGGRITGPAGTNLSVDTDFVFARPMGLRVHAAGRRFDARDLRSTVVGLHVEGRGGIEVDVSGPTNDLDIVGALELDEFVFLDWPFGRMQGDVHWHARRDLEFTRLRGQRGSSSFESEVRVLFADVARGGSRERLELDINVLVPEGHGRAEDLLPIFFGDRIPLKAAVQGSARLFGPPSALAGTAEARATDVRFLWERFDSLDLSAVMDHGDLVVREAFARKKEGGVLFARGTIRRGGGIDLSAQLADMGVEQLAPVADAELPLTGRLAGAVVFTGALTNPDVRGQLSLRDARWGNEHLGPSDLEFTLHERAGRASGSLLGGGLQAAAELSFTGIWPYGFGVRTTEDVVLDPWLPRTVLARSEPVTARIGGVLSGVGTLRDRWHSVRLEIPSFVLARGTHLVEADPAQPVVIALEGGALRFVDVHLMSPDGATDLGVEGWLRLDGPLDVDVAGTVDIAFIDLAADIFERVEARSLQVEQLRLLGTTQALEIEGVVELKEALIKTIYFPHAVELERVRVSLRDRVLRIDEFEGRLGGGTLERASGSTIRLDRSGYRPRQYDLHADCRDCTLRYPSFMPPARGDASMWFRGTSPDQLVLGGKVHVGEMVLRDTMNWQRSLLTFRERATENVADVAQDALFGLDVAVTSDPGMLRIVNNLGDLRGTARGLTIGGDTNRVLITGNVELSGGVFRYKGHEFQLEPGTAEFREGTEWFPWLEVTMFTDVGTRDEDYRVTLNASGRLDNPTLTSGAEPFLTEADINSLLLFGLTQEELERAELRDLVGSALGAAAGTYGESAAASVGQKATGEGRAALPDRLEIVPVYTDTTGSTTFWAVLTKEVVPDVVTLEAGVGLGGASRVGGVARLKVEVARNFFLEGSWVTDETSSQSYGNFGLDLKLELDLD